MQKISVVVICKNEAKNIANTLSSFQGLTDDIVVYDNGSTDGTQQIVKQLGVNLVEGNWEGFGKTKNKAIALAKYDWILCNDADEAIDETAKKELLNSNLLDESTVYVFRFKNFFANKWVRFGEWGNDKHIRLFNRKKNKWSEDAVHETLLLPHNHKTVLLKGFILHQTTSGTKEYEIKMRKYARLGAEKYFRKNKKASWIKIIFSPCLSFLKNYVLKLGFLDGKAGFACARISALYTFLKYKELKAMRQNGTKLF